MPQKQSFSPIITGAVSIKNSPPKVGVNITNYQAFKCPKCHANISFNGQDIDGNLMKFQKHVIAHLCYKRTYFKKLVAGFREMLRNFYLLIQTDID